MQDCHARWSVRIFGDPNVKIREIKFQNPPAKFGAYGQAGIRIGFHGPDGCMGPGHRCIRSPAASGQVANIAQALVCAREVAPGCIQVQPATTALFIPKGAQGFTTVRLPLPPPVAAPHACCIGLFCAPVTRGLRYRSGESCTASRPFRDERTTAGHGPGSSACAPSCNHHAARMPTGCVHGPTCRWSQPVE